MTKFNRRNFLGSTATVAAASSTLGAGALSFAPAAQAQSLSFKPEKGAKLRVLRWSRFVQGDIDAYMANVKKFTEATGVEVRVDNEGWEDVPRKQLLLQTQVQAQILFCRPTTTPTCIQKNYSTSQTCAST